MLRACFTVIRYKLLRTIFIILLLGKNGVIWCCWLYIWIGHRYLCTFYNLPVKEKYITSIRHTSQKSQSKFRLPKNKIIGKLWQNVIIIYKRRSTRLKVPFPQYLSQICWIYSKEMRNMWQTDWDCLSHLYTFWNLEDPYNSYQVGICELHFKPEDFKCDLIKHTKKTHQRKILKNSTIPSLFPL